MKRQTPALIALIAVLVGFALGRASSDGDLARAEDLTFLAQASTNGLAATATRSAELDEISALRTQAASPDPAVACSPEASTGPTATPTPVPPGLAGQPINYGDDWSVTVTDIALMPTFERTTATGIYAKVSVTAVNNTSSALRFPYDEMVLRDATNRVFIPALEVKTQNEANYFALYPPYLPTDGFVVFDIAADAEGPFILESTVDPLFRVLVEVEVRG